MSTNSFSIINPQKFPFFYGYIVLVVGSIGVLFSIPGQTVGVSVFTDPVKDALNLSRNQFSSAYMIGTLLSAFFVTRAGILFDKLGARYVAFFASVLLGVTLLLFSQSVSITQTFQNLFSTTSWLVAFTIITLLFFILRFSGQGVLTMASRNMVMMWFDKNRGKVNSISSIAVSFGFSSSPLLINALIDDYDWQISWQIMAVALFVFSIIILQFYKNKPEDFGLQPDGTMVLTKTKSKTINIQVKNFTLKEAKKTRAFWIIGLVLAFNSFFITGLTFHVVSIFEAHGYLKTEAIAIFIPISVISIIVSTVANILSDYIQHRIYILIMIASGIVAALGLYFLAFKTGVYLLILGLGILGGLFAVVNAVTWPKYYGRKHLGAITGKTMSFLVIASALAPTLFSFSFSIFNDYKYVALIALLFLFGLIVGAWRLKKP
ncbi:MFS transporter [uncultured Algibacter sp.]|uniref:MFS transporter n=1 Tax=uncultured Algibacter sp. TaxID=298659 RepID=UPI00262BCEEA|nr:MFS transporter [uncultured Algibacter sp.]